MIQYYLSNVKEKKLSVLPAAKKECWIHLEAPTPEEIAETAKLASVPEAFLRSALDEEEVAHLDSEGEVRLAVIDIPKMNDNGGALHIYTLPLAIVQAKDYFITVCTAHTTVLDDLFSGKVKNVETPRRAKLLYQILFQNASRFLYYLRQIDKASDQIQRGLSKSMQNKELLQLLELQKSLVFFSASLTANRAVTQKITNNFAFSAAADEREILDDVVIENKQALEMCNVYREIIKSTMDAFASVVNNNQNLIMKFLTAITIILSIPMVIAGFWGMNTGVPFESKLWGFWAAVGISIVISVVIWVVMARKKML